MREEAKKKDRNSGRNRNAAEMKALMIISDLSFLNSVLAYVKEKKLFLQRKTVWLKQRNRQEISEFEELLQLLESLQKRLESRISQLEKNDTAHLLGQQFSRCCQARALNLRQLSERSYFSLADLCRIEQGDYEMLDSLDIEHLIELVGLNSLAELMRG